MSFDYTRAEAELEELGYTDERVDGEQIRSAVLNVLYCLDSQELPPNTQSIVADLVGHVTRKDEEFGGTRGVWKQFHLGDVKRGEIVRVKWDAYDSDTGSKHNGLVGVFLSALSGRCTIRYIGRKDKLDFTHPPSLLEVLKK